MTETCLPNRGKSIQTRIQNARGKVKGIDQDLYHDIRHEKDYRHKSSAQREADKQAAKQRAEQRELERQQLAKKLNTPLPVGSGSSKKAEHKLARVAEHQW